jgi:hypothetical protein
MLRVFLVLGLLFFLGWGIWAAGPRFKEKLTPNFINPAADFFTAGGSEPVVASISGVTVIFPRSFDYTMLMKTLQTILNRATMERKIKTIDLRFEKPVINYGP